MKSSYYNSPRFNQPSYSSPLSDRNSHEEDLRAIADRLNHIIERSNQIDKQLTRIEEVRKPSMHKLNAPNDYISPIKDSFNRSNENSSSMKSPFYASNNDSKITAQNDYISPIRSPRDRSNYGLNNINDNNFYDRFGPNRSTKPSYSFNSPQNESFNRTPSRPSNITLEMMFDAISDLKSEVSEIKRNQEEMKREITRIKKMLE